MDQPTRRLGIRQLRQDLSAAVTAAAGGEQILITLRGRPIARLGPAEPAGQTTVTMESLEAAGLILRPRRSDRPVEPHPIVLPADVRLERVLDHVRGRT